MLFYKRVVTFENAETKNPFSNPFFVIKFMKFLQIHNRKAVVFELGCSSDFFVKKHCERQKKKLYSKHACHIQRVTCLEMIELFVYKLSIHFCIACTRFQRNKYVLNYGLWAVYRLSYSYSYKSTREKERGREKTTQEEQESENRK